MDTTWARGPLMPNPRLMLMPLLMLTTDTTAVDTDTDMVSVMAVTTDMADTPMPMVDTVISARGPLMPNPRLMPLLMLTTDTTAVDTDTDTDTVMAVVTTVRFNRILACRSKNLFHNHIHPATNNNF